MKNLLLRVFNMNGRIRHCQQLSASFVHNPSRLVSSVGHTKLLSKLIVPRLKNDFYQRWTYCGHLFAAISFVKILESLGLKSEKNPEIKELTHRAKDLLKNGNVEEASELYNEALTMAVNVQDNDAIYHIKKKQAVIAFISKRYLDAEKLFVEVRKYRSQTGILEDDLKIMYIDLRLAEIYENLQNYQKAEEHYKICAKNIKSCLKSRSSDPEIVEFWLQFLTSRAHYHLHRGIYEKAMKYFNKAYETSLQKKGEMSEQTVNLLQQLGSVCYQKGDLEKAVVYLNKAIELGRHLPGFVQLADAYISLGNILLKQGLIQEAKWYCDQGQKNSIRHQYKEGISGSNSCLEEVQDATS